ncbi:cation diffusion facilitator family transporter [Anaerolentibacter hominis]|uniref:cation diffusion facilitator family transporter n=1 Tax=Anaerolentibacter hominis TaxID=3079009 RepID=UPI0031B83ACD
MTQWLIRTFIKNADETKNLDVRTSYGKLSSYVGILCNVCLFLGKFIIGTLSGSVSIAADAVNNLSDASSSIISLLGFKMSGKPADEEHPYGHGRGEYLSGLMVAVLILVIGIELFKSSIGKILHPAPVEFSWLSVVVLACAILVKLWMAAFNRRMGRTIHSQTLMATAADSRNDVISTGAVLIAALISHFTSLELDGFMGLGVALFILYSGFGLIKDTLSPLLGQAPDPELVGSIQEKILSYPGVLGTHDLMIHDYGPGRQFASVHVEMAAEDDVISSHDVIDNIERDFLNNDGLHMIVHYDPISTSGSLTCELRQFISEQVKSIHPDLTIHDLRIVPGTTHTNVIFDCVIPHKLDKKCSEIKAEISHMVADKYPNFYCVITIDASYAAMPH